MSWNSCKQSIFPSRATITSDLFKVLSTLKLLHGSRSGAKGSTVEDITMYMIKTFGLDGDIKSQVLAALKHGVKMNFITRKEEKFTLVLPAASIHLAPCKCKGVEIERLKCIFPPTWSSNACNDAACSLGAQSSCCGKRGSRGPISCGQKPKQQSEERDAPCPCDTCHRKRGKKRPKMSSASNGSCMECFPTPRKRRKRPPCPKPRASSCAGRTRRQPCPQPADDLCKICSLDHDEDECNIGGGYQDDAYTNCSCCSK